MAYFHGVEVIDILTGTTPVRTAATSIIGLVGTAPIGAQNTLTLVNSPQDAEQFGGELHTDFTINQALKAIFDQSRASVLVVNVFDPATMVTAVVEESQTITLGKAQLDYEVLLEGTTPVVQDVTAVTTYVEGTDYTLSEYGVVAIIPGGDIVEGVVIKVSYDKPDFSGLAAADFVGVTSPARTGMKLFAEAFDSHGFNPRLIIVPNYSSIEAVAIEMESQCSDFRAMCFVDDVAGTSRTDLISHRTTASNSFNSSSRRLVPVGPWMKAYGHLGTLATVPFSSYMAGITAKTDNEEGYWVSSSNHIIRGISDTEYTMIGSGIADQNSDANLLNGAGIVTVLKVGGSRRSWGNRSAAWPNDADARNFIPIQRVRDIVHDSLEAAMLPFMDKPIVQATIDAIRSSANGFIRNLIQRGALLQGSEVIYDVADNPPAEIALGHLTFQFVSMSGTPAERITFNSIMDINLLGNIS